MKKILLLLLITKIGYGQTYLRLKQIEPAAGSNRTVITGTNGVQGYTTSIPISMISSTTSAGLASIITDETGTGNLVFSASPTLTGVPITPTIAANSNNTQIANTAYVDIKTPCVTPMMFGAVGDNSTNDYAALQACIDSPFECLLDRKYRTVSTLTVSSNELIVGVGHNSGVTVSSNITVFNILGRDNHFDNFSVEGTTANGHGGINWGISATGNAGLTLYYVNNIISRCHFKNLNVGVLTSSVVGTASAANHEGAYTVSDCIFENCSNGTYCGARGEYNTYSNNKVQACTNGHVVIGGNNNFIGGQVTDCTNGFVFGSGTNDAHGLASGMKINHCTNGITGAHSLDWLFDGCMIYSNNISLTSVGKTKFIGCNISMTSNTLTITNSPVAFYDCEFVASPATYSLTGTAPVVSNCYSLTTKMYTPTLPYTELTTGTLDFASTAAGASTDLTIAVTGSVLSDVVSLGVPNSSIVANGTYTAWVSAAGTVTVRFTNTNLITTLDPASGSFKVFLHK